MKKIPVGILGATGIVGQNYLNLLQNHPWFEVTFLAASENSHGKTYEEAVSGRWHLKHPLPKHFKNLPVYTCEEIAKAKESCSFVFSALSNEGAKIYEELYAQNDLPVISNASYHRSFTDIPILIPEVNPHHLEILSFQKKHRNWKRGFIVTKPNCSLQSYMIPLHSLHKLFKVKRLCITTLQAVSGAGYPGVSSLNILDNIIPYIPQEEEKTEQEPLKIWGQIDSEGILPNTEIFISAHCNRVPILDGHTACISVEFQEKPGVDEIIGLWENFEGLNLPSAPQKPIVYLNQPDRPQPKLDKDAERGMGITVGRLRKCPVLDYRFVCLSHNTIRGAAGGGILNAELLVQQGHL